MRGLQYQGTGAMRGHQYRGLEYRGTNTERAYATEWALMP